MIADIHPAVQLEGLPNHTTLTIIPLERDPIPIEVLERIITSSLSPSELAACASTSRTFNLIATSILYKTVRIDFCKSHMLVFSCDVPSNTCKPAGIFNGALIASISLTAPRKASLDFLSSRLAHTTHLILPAHSLEHCRRLASTSLNLPILQSLRILPSTLDDRLDLCISSESQHGPRLPIPCCPLMRGLTPRQIVMGGLTTSLAGSARGLYSPRLPPSPHIDGPSFPPPSVKQLVIHVGMLSGVEYGVGAGAGAFFLAQLPATVDRVTFVLSTAQAGWLASKKGRLCYDDYCIHYTLDRLAGACSGLAREIELVAYESTEDCWNDEAMNDDDALSFKDTVRQEVERHLVMKGESFQAAEKKAIRIEFVGAAEWRARGGGEVGVKAETPGDWDPMSLALHIKVAIFPELKEEIEADPMSFVSDLDY